jgi:serine/threonine-protein kinase
VARSDERTRSRLLEWSFDSELDRSDLPRGLLEDRYELGELVGAGGMGFVIGALDRKTNERVAVKFMHRRVANDPSAVARFEREASAMAALRSRHTVRVFEIGVSGGLPYLVMEYLEGLTLAALVGKRGPLPWYEAVRFIVEACHAIAEAHDLGIVHRDIKPQNLFLSRTPFGPVVRVLDFGLAKSLGDADGLTITSRVIGTPQYMSPEQIRDARTADQRSDVWALGATLYRLLSGRHAFWGPNVGVVCAEVLHAAPAPLRSTCPEVPADLERIVMRCLERDPAARFGSARALQEALEQLAKGVESNPRRTQGVRRRRVAAAVAIGVLALAASAVTMTRAASRSRVADPAPPSPTTEAEETPSVPAPPGASAASVVPARTQPISTASGKLGKTPYRVAPKPAASSHRSGLYDRF